MVVLKKFQQGFARVKTHMGIIQQTFRAVTEFSCQQVRDQARVGDVGNRKEDAAIGL